jgi:TetR/AcrR family transcriptional regulator, transcriptional repressor for nem operon
MARPREFDHEVALDRAMAAFWAKGYDATSIEDLVARMGIQRGSLYGAFGDKRTLFLAALDRYERVVVRELFDALEAPGPGIEAIRRFFRLRIEGSLERRRPLGCLLTNSAVELPRRDPGAAARVGTSLARLERAFYRALVRARNAGEIAASRNVRALARFLTSSAQGLSVIATVAPERSVLEDIVAVILSVLEPASAKARRGRRMHAASRPGRRAPLAAGRPSPEGMP